MSTTARTRAEIAVKSAGIIGHLVGERKAPGGKLFCVVKYSAAVPHQEFGGKVVVENVIRTRWFPKEDCTIGGNLVLDPDKITAAVESHDAVLAIFAAAN